MSKDRIEELLDESAWLRRLATRLVSDEAEADDVVQETWLAALRRAPRDIKSPRGWLESALRSARITRFRGRVRDQRVAARAALELRASDAQSTEKTLSLQRQLLEAVEALPEPERTLIRWRWLEERSIAYVATTLGISRSATRSRLSRALALLRTRMAGKRQGGRRDLALALIGLADLRAASARLFAVSAAKAAVAVAGLAAVIVFAVDALRPSSSAAFPIAHPNRDGAMPSSVELPARNASAPTSTSPVETSLDAPTAPPVDSTVIAPPAPPDPSSLAFVEGRVVDAFGRPAPKALVRLDIIGQIDWHTLRDVGQDGRFRLPFDRFGAMRFSAAAPGLGTAVIPVIQLESGRTVQLGDLALRGDGRIGGVVVDAAGRGLSLRRLRFVPEPPEPGWSRFGDPTWPADRSRVRHGDGLDFAEVQSREGGAFTAAGLRPGRYTIHVVDGIDRRWDSDSAYWTGSDDVVIVVDSRSLHVFVDAPEDENVQIVSRIIFPDGRPDRLPWHDLFARTADIEVPPQAIVHVGARIDVFAFDEATVAFDDGSSEKSIRLTPYRRDATATLRLRIINEAGAPLPGARAWLLTALGELSMTAIAPLGGGEFELRVPAGNWTIVVQGPAEDVSTWRPARSTVGVIDGVDRDVVMTLERSARLVLRGLKRDGTPVERDFATAVSIVQTSSGLAIVDTAPLRQLGGGRFLVSTHLSAGPHRVTVEFPDGKRRVYDFVTSRGAVTEIDCVLP